ncbi:hypothetical protein [Nocardia sp. NPDC058114]|uniref:hypothetical protein n=1 Tax=Nocardia sp. NPDC058114 TaxID=3346346 RepID=UPI0036DBD16C
MRVTVFMPQLWALDNSTGTTISGMWTTFPHVDIAYFIREMGGRCAGAISDLALLRVD